MYEANTPPSPPSLLHARTDLLLLLRACACACERYGRSVVLAWLTVCGCVAARRGGFFFRGRGCGAGVAAEIPEKCSFWIRVRAYIPPSRPSPIHSHVSLLLLKVYLKKVMKRGVEMHRWEARASLQDACVFACVPSIPDPGALMLQGEVIL